MTDLTRPISWSRTHLSMLRGICLILALSAVAAGDASAQEDSDDRQSPSSSPSSSDGAAEEDIWAGVEQLIVTGSSATELLSDLASADSVTAFDGEALQAIGASDISDIAAFTPNLEIVTAGATSPTLFIRGIGLNDFSANAAGSVTIIQDEVTVNSPALQLGTLFDIETTNVLRGPQGTGAYRNSSAGAIKVYSNKPSGDFGANLQADFGNYDLVDIQGAVGFPIVSDVLAGRVAFRMIRRDGLMKNRCGGALPESQRVARPQGQASTDPRWSICGEEVRATKVSDIEAGLPDRLNDRDNWAARGLLRFRPDLDALDMDWLLILRGSRRDELSVVGQSIGTVGVQRFPELAPPGTSAPEWPRIDGILGGVDNGGFRDADVIADRVALRNELLAACAPSCTAQEAGAVADRKLAADLARELDSDPFAGAFSRAGKTRNETFGATINGEIGIGNTSMILHSVSSYDQWERLIDVDLDFTANTLFETRTEDEGWQVYQELRLEGEAFDALTDLLGGGLLEWEIGAYALHESLEAAVENDFGDAQGLGLVTARQYEQKVTSFAGFASFNWELYEDFTLDGGVRFNSDRREIDYQLFVNIGRDLQNEDITNSEPTGTIRLTYQAGLSSSVYAKYTRGWKSGTFNATGSKALGVTFAKPEVNSAFEVGFRGDYFDGRLDLFASFFHYAYENYQIFTSRSGFQAPPEFVILNAEDVQLFGSEVEATLKPWEGGLLSVNFGWLEGEFLEFTQTQVISQADPFNPGQPLVFPIRIDSSGNRLLNAPRYSVILSVQQTFLLGRFGTLTPRYDGTWKDDTFFDASEGQGIPNNQGIQFLPPNTIGQEAFWLHNLRLTYRSPDGELSVSGWVRNLTDKTYKVFSADLTTFQNTTLHFVGDPRLFGVSVGFTF